jgi:hypothetical protein
MKANGASAAPNNSSSLNIKPQTPSVRQPDRRSQLPQQRSGLLGEDYTGGKANGNGGGGEDAGQIVKALRENRNKSDVLRQHLHRLRNLGGDDPAGAIYEIREIMNLYRNDSHTLAMTTGAVWSITSSNDDKKIEAADAGIVTQIVDSLRNPTTKNDSDYIPWALGCLTCLAPESRELIAESGGIEAILDMLRFHQTCAGVFEWGCRALYRLVYRFDDEGDSQSNAAADKSIKKNLASIEEDNGISAIVAAMKLHVSESVAQLWAMKLLWRLQDRTDLAATTRVLHKILDDDGVGTCMKVLKSRSTRPELYQITAELMCTLLEALDREDQAFANAVDCIPITARVMEEDATDELLQQACCRLLATLVLGGGDSKLQIKDSHAIRVVVDAMCNHPRNVALQESATRLLWTMSTVPAFFDFNHLDRALRAIDSAMARHKDATDLFFVACGFVTNICLAPQASAESFPMSLITRSFQTQDSKVHLQATRALTNLCSKFPELVHAVISGSCVESLVNNLSLVNQESQHSSCLALTLLANASDASRTKIVAEGGLAAAAALVQASAEPSIVDDCLGLITVLAAADLKQTGELRGEIVQSILLLMQSDASDGGLVLMFCSALRNLILGAPAGYPPFAVEDLVNSMLGVIDSASSTADVRMEACSVMWAIAGKQPIQSAPILSSMFRSVIGLMGKYKGEEYNSDLQCVAAGALSSITSCIRDAPIHFANADIDALISLMYVYMERDLARTDLLQMILDVILNISFVDESTVIQCGGIVVVIDAMVEHEQNELIQEKGCGILALLSSTENLQVNLSIAETDGIDMIVSALAVFSTNDQIQVDACKALSHLSVDQESRMLISSQGGLILLVNAMNSHRENVHLLEGACSALLNLSSDAEEQVIMDSNIVETVVDLMGTHPDSDKLQEKGLGILQNISMRSGNAKRAIADARGITVVTNAIKEYMGMASVLERAFTTMWSLAVLPDNQIHIANAGGINLVINGMMANITHERVQKQACGCLCTLSSNSRNKTIIRDAGGVDAIVYAMWAHYASEGLQIEACRALSSLAVNVQTNEVMIASDGEINAIILAMRRFSTSAKLQEHACVALRNFLLSADNNALISSSGEELRVLLTQAANRFPDKCSERARQVLASLS